MTSSTRRFTVFRTGDLTATHNSDQANPADQPQFEGVIFTDGTTVIRWLTAARSTSVWENFDAMWKIHGHDGPGSNHGTRLVWHDVIEERNMTSEHSNEVLANARRFVEAKADGDPVLVYAGTLSTCIGLTYSALRRGCVEDALAYNKAALDALEAFGIGLTS